MHYFPLILLLFFGIGFLLWPVMVLIHELGHAIPYLIFTRKPVTIYIGSYGGRTSGIKVRIGLLTVHVSRTLFWKGGLCVPSEHPAAHLEIVCIISGSLGYFLVAGLACLGIFAWDLHGLLKLIAVIASLLAVLGLCSSLIPHRPSASETGSPNYNDGYLLATLLSDNRFQKKYKEGLGLYHVKQYAAAAEYFINSLQAERTNQECYRLAISSLYTSGQYSRALKTFNEMENKFSLSTYDHHVAGFLNGYFDQYAESLQHLTTALQAEPDNVIVLMNIAYLMNCLQSYQLAIEYASRAVAIDPIIADADTHLGLALYKLGKKQEGIQHLQRALQKSPNNAMVHKNLAIYYAGEGNHSMSLEHFEKATLIDPKTHGLQDVMKKI